MDANCQVCGRPVRFADKGRGLVHAEPLGQMVVTKAEAIAVIENAELNKSREPHNRVYGLILHQPEKEKE